MTASYGDSGDSGDEGNDSDRSIVVLRTPRKRLILYRHHRMSSLKNPMPGERLGHRSYIGSYEKKGQNV
jgi:hypothetical protein